MYSLKFLLLQKKSNKLIRVVEHHDWVIYCIIGIILSYIIIFKTLHRDVTLIEFILQPYENQTITL